ncbi:hypothetical protein N431DRAFT_450374 [Stipitochalara longipes BDJ]|nr:hypothetical protein N431DRAFT_450374 [Stipitochalara longipes BDJ]
MAYLFLAGQPRRPALGAGANCYYSHELHCYGDWPSRRRPWHDYTSRRPGHRYEGATSASSHGPSASLCGQGRRPGMGSGPRVRGAVRRPLMARKHGQGAVLQPQSALGRDTCAYCTGKSEDEAGTRIDELKQWCQHWRESPDRPLAASCALSRLDGSCLGSL